jgi:hypothetical protein
LLRLHEELSSRTYQPGPCRTFTIDEGKKRPISAAPFRDRVVHQALTGVLEPIFERSPATASTIHAIRRLDSSCVSRNLNGAARHDCMKAEAAFLDG